MHPAANAPAAADRSAGMRGLVGLVLAVAGLVLCVSYRFTASGEPHSYAAGADAPAEVHVTLNHTYHLAVHGGIHAEQDHGLVPAALGCTYAVTPGQDRTLTVAPEDDTTKATDVIGSFVAPVTGRVHVACSGLDAVFVDDADDAPFDRAGFLLLAGTVALAVGVALGLSGLRGVVRGTRSARYGEDDEV